MHQPLVRKASLQVANQYCITEQPCVLETGPCKLKVRLQAQYIDLHQYNCKSYYTCVSACVIITMCHSETMMMQISV